MSLNVLSPRPALTLVLLTVLSGLVACESRKAGEAAAPQQSSRPAANQPSQREVVIRGMKYQPADLTVHVGETVVWKNDDIFPHTVSAADQSFESGTIQPGASWTYVAKTAGAHAYICKPHPNMKAKLVVE
jgi:plastocyanin